MRNVIWLALIFSVRFTPGASGAEADFHSTTDTIGWKTNATFATPVNQLLTPTGKLIELPGVRPNALALSPNGKLLVTSGLKGELIVLDAKDGKTLQHVILPARNSSEKIDATSSRVLKPNLHDKLSFTGLAFSPDGKRIYLSNVNGDIKVFAVDKSGKVSGLFSFGLPHANKPNRTDEIPAGIAVAPDGNSLYVACNVADHVIQMDTRNGKIVRSWDVGEAPFAVVLAGKKLYVSNWGGRRPDAASQVGPIGLNGKVRVDARSVASEGSVSVIDLDSASSGAKVELLTGVHACGLAVSADGKFVACANAGSDTVSIIDTAVDRVIETISAKQNPGDPFGAQPNALTFDKSGNRLFVCNGSQNAVAVFEFDPGKSTLLGLIPVGWFPGSIAYDSYRRRLDVANIISVTHEKEEPTRARGRGKGYNSKEYFGSLSLVAMPSKKQLSALTAKALDNIRYPLLTQAKLAPRTNQPAQPVPERVGEPSVIQHVVYIIKENRTYDQVLGDVKEGDGDPDLCVFGQLVTPNEHKFVHDFILLDNTYCSSIVSAEGHQWTDSAIGNDYIQRSYAGWPRSYPGAGGEAHGYDALAYSTAGFIWNDATEHGKTVRVFGEFTTPHHFWKATHKSQEGWLESYRDFISGSNAIGYYAEVGLGALIPYVETNYVGFDLTVPDVIRASQFIKNLKRCEQSGELPALNVIWLPDDHTTATKFGAPKPASQVADNDYAFGKMVEAISHSRFWTNTVIFAIEDDAQDGWDHVSGYRTTAYVIGPYVKRHQTIHTQYNHTSLLRTIELILGLPPMNQMDATATPMFDCFTGTPDFSPYEKLTNNIPLDDMNPKAKDIKDAALRKDAYTSGRLPLAKEDQCPEDVLNRILWRATKGSSAPYPDWAVTKVDKD